MPLKEVRDLGVIIDGELTMESQSRTSCGTASTSSVSCTLSGGHWLLTLGEHWPLRSLRVALTTATPLCKPYTDHNASRATTSDGDERRCQLVWRLAVASRSTSTSHQCSAISCTSAVPTANRPTVFKRSAVAEMDDRLATIVYSFGLLSWYLGAR